MTSIRCSYCGRRTADGLLLADVRGVRYDYCDAACATAHRMAVDLTATLCPDCDEDAVGDTGCCSEHLPVDVERAAARRRSAGWRRAG